MFSRQKKREKTKVPEEEKDRKRGKKGEREEGAKVLKKLNRESMREREWEKEVCVKEMTERAWVHDKQKTRERDNK